MNFAATLNAHCGIAIALADAAHHRMTKLFFLWAVQPTNRGDCLMSTLQKTIASSSSPNWPRTRTSISKKIEQITDLLAADKKPKAEDFAKVFAFDDAGDIE